MQRPPAPKRIVGRMLGSPGERHEVNEKTAIALVLRAVDYGEADRVVTLFTRELGKVAAFARSARASRKRFGGSLEPFHRLEIRYRERRGDLLSLSAAEIRRARPAIATDLDRIAVASYLSELAAESTREREPHPEVFDLLDGALEALGDEPSPPLEPARRDGWLAGIELRLLALVGYRPRLDGCVACGAQEPERYRFSPERGGVLCPACGGTRGLPVSASTARLLESTLTTDVAHFDQVPFGASQAEEARALLAAFLRYQLGKELKSVRFVR